MSPSASARRARAATSCWRSRPRKAKGLIAAAFAGKDGGLLKGVADPLLIVPSSTTARIQEMHIMLGQMLCGALEIELGLA